HARGGRVLRRVRGDRRRPGADHGRLGRRLPQRRDGAAAAALAAALRFPPALRGQGPLRPRDGAGPDHRGPASATRTARRGRAGAAAMIRFHSSRNPDAWRWAVAVTVAGALRRRLEDAPRARLLVSGGSTPAPVLEGLSQAPLDWSRDRKSTRLNSSHVKRSYA